MILAQHTKIRHEMLHWLWLWMLAAIAIAAMQATASGQIPRVLPPPLPIPNVDDPDLFRYPTEQDRVDPELIGSLKQVLELNQQGDFEAALKQWKTVHVAESSMTWKHVGIGVAHLRIGNLDKALEELNKSVALDPRNAVAEYLLGRVRQAQGRLVPFWYQRDDDSPYRLVVHRNQDRPVEDRMFLPHHKGLPLKQQAKRHFNRAVQLAPKCNLDRSIEVIKPQIRFISQSASPEKITVRDLLVSIGEVDYEAKANEEIGGRSL